jgi:predicted metal-dependent peptidase
MAAPRTQKDFLEIKDQAVNWMIHARTTLIIDSPFFGTLAMKLKMKIDPSCDTAWTDGTHIGYNPWFIQSLTKRERIGLVAHEVMHCALLHHTRRGHRNPRMWNIACDYVINSLLIHEGFSLPKCGLLDRDWSDKFSEEAYRLLNEEMENNKHQSIDDMAKVAEKILDELGSGSLQEDADENEDQNEDQDDGGEGSEGEGTEESDEEGDGEGEGEGEGTGGSGSGEFEGDESHSQDGLPSDIGGCGEIRDAVVFDEGDEEGENPRPASESEKSQQEESWKIAVQQAVAQAGLSAGSSLGKSITSIFGDRQSKIDWRQAVEEFVTARAKSDWTYLRANRRFSQSEYQMPTLHSDELGKIVWIIDTSGSVSDKQLNSCASEMDTLLEQFPTSKFHVLYVDDNVNGGDEVSINDCPLKLTVHGRGGTAYGPAFDWVSAYEDGEIEGVIYFTDLMPYGKNAWGTEPDCPVLWVYTNPYGRNTPKVPFGTVVPMYDDED